MISLSYIYIQFPRNDSSNPYPVDLLRVNCQIIRQYIHQSPINYTVITGSYIWHITWLYYILWHIMV